MIFIHTSQLKPGMIVAQAVSNIASVVPLLLANQKLTANNIARLKALHIPGIYIKTKHSEDIVAHGVLDPEVKQKAIADLKDVCQKFIAGSSINAHLVNDFMAISSSILDDILSKDDHIISMIEIKNFDNYTYSHSVNVASLATLIGIQLGYSRISLRELTMAGLMHDIGKLDIPISIINKPGALDEHEYELIRRHPDFALKRLSPSMRISLTVLDGIGSHHEKYDGSGYPLGLDGSSIPLCGRILAVADVYDALTTSRPYRPAWDIKDTLDFMASKSGTHFDPYVLDAFFKTIAVYPIGTLVKLTDGSIALVVGHTPGCMLDPVVRILSSTTMSSDEDLDLSKIADLHIAKSLDADHEIPYEIFE